MGKTEKKWMYTGALMLVVTTLTPAFIETNHSPFAPFPIYLMIFARVLSFGYFLVMPALYILCFWLLNEKSFFGLFVFLTSLVVTILGVWFFIELWPYGLKYQGQRHTEIVAIENAIGFFIQILISFFGFISKSKTMQSFSLIFLFFLLSWCAFPYLGEYM